MKLTNIIRKPRIVALVASLAVAATSLFALAPTAGATNLIETPHFQCYSYTNGTAKLVAEPPSVNYGGNVTEWGALVYRWNGSAWALTGASRAQSLNNEFMNFGSLFQQNDEFSVAPHSFYAVKYVMKDNTDAQAGAIWATPIMHHYGANSCWT
jgi:hypothetical protein